MAQLQRYNHTAKKIMEGSFDNSELRAILLNASAVFNPAHTLQSEVTNNGAWDVDGNGWDVGGVKLPGLVISILNVNEGMLDFDDITRMATGGDIGPCDAMLISDGQFPLFYQLFSGTQLAPEGTVMHIYTNVSGLYRLVNP